MKDMPRHDLVVWILWRRMRMEARWERSPRKRNMFIVGEVRVGEWKTGDCRYSITAPDV